MARKRTASIEAGPIQSADNAAVLEIESPAHAEELIGEEQNFASNDAKNIFEATDRLLKEDLGMPKRPSSEGYDELPIEQKIATLNNKKEKFQNGLADYEYKLSERVDNKIKPLIEKVYGTAVNEAKTFSQAEKEIAEKEAKYLKNEADLGNLFASGIIKEKEFEGDVLKLTAIKNKLEEEKNLYALMQEEVKNSDTTDHQAKMIQFGNYILETQEMLKNEKNQEQDKINKEKEIRDLGESFTKRIQNACLKSYEDRSGKRNESIYDVMNDAKVAGFVKDKLIEGKTDQKTGEKEKSKTILVPTSQISNELLKTYFAKLKELYKEKDEYNKTKKEVDDKVKQGWIAYRKGAVKLTKITNNGKSGWLAETIGDTGELQSGFQDRLPKYLYLEATKNDPKNKKQNKFNNSENSKN